MELAGTDINWLVYIDDKTSIKDGDFPFFKQPEPRRTGHNWGGTRRAPRWVHRAELHRIYPLMVNNSHSYPFISPLIDPLRTMIHMSKKPWEAFVQKNLALSISGKLPIDGHGHGARFGSATSGSPSTWQLQLHMAQNLLLWYDIFTGTCLLIAFIWFSWIWAGFPLAAAVHGQLHRKFVRALLVKADLCQWCRAITPITLVPPRIPQIWWTDPGEREERSSMEAGRHLLRPMSKVADFLHYSGLIHTGGSLLYRNLLKGHISHIRHIRWS